MSNMLLLLITNVIFTVKINPQTKQFEDENGRTLIFHGVNVVYKVKPYKPIIDKWDYQQSFSLEDIFILKKNGFNAIRLGIIWEAVETYPGLYDLEYIDYYFKII